jgi:beta-glucosidase-like glycosyl hydrolase
LVQAELEDTRKELAKARKAGGQVAAVEEEMARQMEEELAAEKEKRIEHTKEMAVRRIFKRELTRGWVAWYDLYVEKVRKANLLKASASRLARPKLVACVHFWREDWRAETLAHQQMMVAQKLHSETKERGHGLHTEHLHSSWHPCTVLTVACALFECCRSANRWQLKWSS